MAGITIATALGAFGATAAAGVTTGALIGAGIGAATTIGSGVSSFSQANAAKKQGANAEAALKKSLKDARRKIEVNYMEEIGIMKEPYELARNALLTSGNTALQGAQEAEERGAAATAGRIQMAQNEAQGQVRTAMGQEMLNIQTMVAKEDANIARMQASIDLEEAAGAAEAMKSREEQRAAAITAGMGTVKDVAKIATDSWAAGDFAKNKSGTPDYNKGFDPTNVDISSPAYPQESTPDLFSVPNFGLGSPPIPDPYITPGAGGGAPLFNAGGSMGALTAIPGVQDPIGYVTPGGAPYANGGRIASAFNIPGVVAEESVGPRVDSFPGQMGLRGLDSGLTPLGGRLSNINNDSWAAVTREAEIMRLQNEAERMRLQRMQQAGQGGYGKGAY